MKKNILISLLLFPVCVLAGGYSPGNSSVLVSTHINDPSAAHAASAIGFTPAGGIAATNVQDMAEELDTEKAGLATENTFTGNTNTFKNIVATEDSSIKAQTLTAANWESGTGTFEDRADIVTGRDESHMYYTPSETGVPKVMWYVQEDAEEFWMYSDYEWVAKGALRFDAGYKHGTNGVVVTNHIGSGTNSVTVTDQTASPKTAYDIAVALRTLLAEGTGGITIGAVTNAFGQITYTINDDDAGGGGGGGFPITLDEWYDMELQDPSAAPHRAWADGGGNTVYARALGETNTWNLFFDFRVVTGATVAVTSPLVWETGTNQTASVICNVKYAYDDTLQASVTNTTSALGTIATATQGEQTICAWTNTIGTGHYRFWFDKGDSAVAYGELGFLGAPTITITEP